MNVLIKEPTKKWLCFFVCSTVVALLWKPSERSDSFENFSASSVCPPEASILKFSATPEAVEMEAHHEDVKTNNMGFEKPNYLPLGPGFFHYVVEAGDILCRLLPKYGVPLNEALRLAQADPGLQHLKQGQTLSWKLDETGCLEQLNWSISAGKTNIYKKMGSSFVTKTEEITGTWKQELVSGIITDNFSTAAAAAQLSLQEISQIQEALQWQINFKQLRSGDRFAVVLMREYLNSHYASSRSRVLAVRLRTHHQDYYAFTDASGRFYDANGRGSSTGFLPRPTLRSYPVTSHFNLYRKHPITRRIKPHQGVDWGTPLKTPVVAIADGIVKQAGYLSCAGNYLTIEHAHGVVTRYFHLNNLSVRQGQRIKRGEIIALTGNTGRSTGPHLHFEIHLHGKPVDPLTVKLPRLEQLDGPGLKAHQNRVVTLRPQLLFT